MYSANCQFAMTAIFAENMVGTVGILAYGSLIGDPGDEIAPIITSRLAFRHRSPVEFAGKVEREGGPTLVRANTAARQELRYS
ncbi:hypothetical protein MAXJ12_33179 [Mesorhizobium alhagi CCNWXJ12-2]|uniref:Uncharacterized protein n=1 Tax=Mesorhizobium alhagi CCNWXJ12-2 TaxID=1107882 RepID=H0I2D4_9HYPH|nr:hypothetical protein MAXJ12_33179 [Mesorhizobium alhagi CCNWXJ12-2]